MQFFGRLLSAVTIAALIFGQGLPAFAAQPTLPVKLAVTTDTPSVPALPGSRVTVTVALQDSTETSLPAEEIPLTVRLNGKTELANVAYTPGAMIAAGATGTTFDVWLTGPFSGDVLVEVQVPVNERRYIVRGATTIRFTSGQLAQVSLNRDVPLYVPAENPQGLFTAYLADSEGAYVTRAGVELLVYAYDKAGGMDATGDVTVNGVTTDSAHPLRMRTGTDGAVALTVAGHGGIGSEYVLAVFLAAGEAQTAGDSITMRIVQSVPATLRVSVQSLDGLNLLRLTAGDTFVLKVAARDKYGKAVEGLEQDLQLTAGDRVLARANPTGPADLISSEELAAMAWQSDEPGIYSLVLAGGKAGSPAIQVSYPFSQQPLISKVYLRVTAGAFAALTVDDRDSDPDQAVELRAGVARPFGIKFTDFMGNPVILKAPGIISIGVDGGSPIAFRVSPYGANLPYVQVGPGTYYVTLYAIAPSPGTYEVPFAMDGASTTATFVVQP